jgi:hypothetical protein
MAIADTIDGSYEDYSMLMLRKSIDALTEQVNALVLMIEDAKKVSLIIVEPKRGTHED